MAKFGVRPVNLILSGLVASHPQLRNTKLLVRAISPIVPSDYIDALERVGECEIAGDFRFLGPKRAREENDRREAPLAGLGTAWWLFGISGTGDGWLVRRSGEASEVAFLDHDQESSAKPRAMGLSFGGWLELADLMSQVERAQDEDAALVGSNHRLVPSEARRVKTQMNKIAKGLSKSYPYSF